MLAKSLAFSKWNSLIMITYKNLYNNKNLNNALVAAWIESLTKCKELTLEISL